MFKKLSILLAKFCKLRFMVVVIGSVILPGCQILDGSSGQSPKAVFIIVDGIPADVIESASTPSIDDLAGTEGYARAYIGGEIGGATQSPTVSAVGYNSLLTGTWANKHNVYDNAIENPNYQYWDIFRILKEHDSALRTAIFSTWMENRTLLVGDGLDEAGGNKLDYYFDGFERDEVRFPHDEERTYIRDIDDLVSTEAARYLSEQGPDLSWIYLEYTDDIGHMFGDGPRLIDAVTLLDGYVGKIWDAVHAREENYNEDWLVVVTTDHGRDDDAGRSHGGQSERERTTWIATNSDELNQRFREMPAIVDILPSIVNHLELTIPADIAKQLDGEPFID